MSSNGPPTQQPSSDAAAPTVAAPPSSATDAVLVPSTPMPENVRKIRGVDFNDYTETDITVPELVTNMSTMGFQASAVADAVRIIDDMVRSFPHFTLRFLQKERELGENLLSRGGL